MARQVNPLDPSSGFPSERKFSQDGSICDLDLTIFSGTDGTKTVEFDAHLQSTHTKLTLQSGPITTDTTIRFPTVSGTLALSASAGPAFGIVQPITGTSPTATVASDILTLSSGDSSISVLGNSGTNTLDIRVAGSYVNSIGAIDGTSKSANGAVISSGVLYLQSTDASFPGLITTGTQTIAGTKTFTSLINANGGIDRSSAGTLSIGTNSATATTINIGNSSATVNIQGSTIFENTQTLIIADPTIVLNSGGSAGSAANSGITLEENAIITGYAESSADRNSWILKAPNTAGIATITPGASGITLAGSVTSGTNSGTNTGDVTLTAVGAAPSANGATLSGQALTLQPADGTHPGVITSGTQTIGGAKTFSGAISASNLSGTNTGDQTITLTGDITGSGTGSFATTLATVNNNVGSFGSSTSIPSVTVNAKGLVTAASGNVVIAPAGTLTGTTLASNVVTSSLTSVGTVTSGTWNGTTIAIANGGTGQTTANAGFNALSPMTTGGDIIYGGASGVATRLANGSAGQVLTSSGTTVAPTWTTVSASPAGSTGQIQFNNAGAFAADSLFVWDDTNNRLGIGTASPISSLHVINGTATLAITSNATPVQIKATVTGTTTAALPIINIDNTSGGTAIAGINFRNNNATPSLVPSAAIQAALSVTTGGVESGFLALATRNAGTLTEWARLDNAGNLGLGTTSPNTTLDVRGYIEWNGQSRVSSTFSKTSDTSLASITGLSATLVAGKTYYFDLQLFTTSNVAGGVNVDLNGGTATATAIIGNISVFDGSVISTQVRVSALNTAAGATTVTTAYVEIRGTITVNGAGTFIPRFAQNASNGAASTVAIGSTMLVQQIN